MKLVIMIFISVLSSQRLVAGAAAGLRYLNFLVLSLFSLLGCLVVQFSADSDC